MPVEQCAYKEGRRRCRRNGTGNPPLCRPHRIALEAAAAAAAPEGMSGVTAALHEYIHKGKIGAKTLERAVAEGLGSLGALFGLGTPPFVPPAGMRFPPNWRPGGGIPPAQPPPIDLAAERRKREIAAARAALGFGNEPLTEDIVKRRKRELARSSHPDHGGDARRMSAINTAADVLLASMSEARGTKSA